MKSAKNLKIPQKLSTILYDPAIYNNSRELYGEISCVILADMINDYFMQFLGSCFPAVIRP